MAELERTADGLRVQLGSLLPGLVVEVVEQTGSTNSDLLSRAREGAASFGAASFVPQLLIAERQTAGRGRHGRSWLAEPGASLTFSIALGLPATDWSGLSLAVGVALAEALEPDASTGALPRLQLKWPNDLWLVDGPTKANGRKLGGILIETLPLGGSRIAVIGIGVNVKPVPANDGLPYATGCMQEIEPAATVATLLARVAAPVVTAVQRFATHGFVEFHARYAPRDLLLGRTVSTTQAGVPVGICEGVAADGSLVVRTPDGVAAQISSGEVSVRFDRADDETLDAALGPLAAAASPC